MISSKKSKSFLTPKNTITVTSDSIKTSSGEVADSQSDFMNVFVAPEKELIVIEGKSDGPGKPLLYGTSKNFMDHFGLKSVKELPKLKDLHIADNEIGMPNDLMDDDEIPVDLAPGHLIEHDEMATSERNQGTNEENITLDENLEQHLPSSEPENEQEP